MKRLFFALLLIAGCNPGAENRCEAHVEGLADLYTWDSQRAGMGQEAYESVVLMWPDIYDALISHLTDSTPTKIMDMAKICVPTVGDVCFQILVVMTNTRVEDYRSLGVDVIKGVDNPIFATRFNPGARERLQAHFRKKRNPS